MNKTTTLPDWQHSGSDGHKATWSGTAAPPSVGATVPTYLNEIGEIKITGYTTIEGYLGVVAVPLTPPDWYLKNCEEEGTDTEGVWFGLDLDRD